MSFDINKELFSFWNFLSHISRYMYCLTDQSHSFVGLPLPVMVKCSRLYAEHFCFFSILIIFQRWIYASELNWIVSDNSKIFLSVWHFRGPKSVFPNTFTRLSFILVEPHMKLHNTSAVLDSLLSTCLPSFPIFYSCIIPLNLLVGSFISCVLVLLAWTHIMDSSS